MDEKKYVICRHDFDDIYTYIRTKLNCRTHSIQRATHYTLEEAQKEMLRLNRKYGEKYYIAVHESSR